MKIIANHKLIARNAKIGKYANGAAILILLGGLVLSYIRQDLFWLSGVALLLGFGLSQFSFYYINRFGRKPRLDEQVAGSLKGLPNDYVLYQYNTPASHLLVGPAGIWIILPYYQRGTIVYQGNRWKQKNAGFAATYMKIFAQEGLGRPDLDLEAEEGRLKDFISKKLDGKTFDLQAALLFVNKNVILQADNAPVPTIQPGELKEIIRRRAKESPLSPDVVKSIRAILPQEIRAENQPSGEKSRK